jgi:putative redox protein
VPTTTVRWVTGKQFVGSDENNHSIVLSGEKMPRGVSPSQLLLIGLAACTAYDVLDIMAKKRQPLHMLEISASGEHDPEPPWPYRRIHLMYRLAGDGLTEKGVAQAIQLSHEKYCSVAATVRGVAQITTEFEIVAQSSP